MGKEGEIDRLGMRARPPGTPVMHQRWEDLLFLHWSFEPEALRPLIPDALEIDTFDGKAWVGITPFHLEDVRPSMLPAVPGLSSFDELNVRTYVVHKNQPGIWFFSLDASKLISAVAARIFFMLPYYRASIDFCRESARFDFDLNRAGPPHARFQGTWGPGERLRDPDRDSLAFFLVERYGCFQAEGRSVYQTRIYHHPWILDEARVERLSSTMLTALGLPEPNSDPLLHFSKSLEVEVWAPVPVGETTARPPGRKIPIT